VKTFVCPSDSVDSITPTAPGTGTPYTTSGVLAFRWLAPTPGNPNSGTATTVYFATGAEACGRTNYTSLAGGLGRLPGNAWDPWAGPMYTQSKVPVIGMSDGSSNTIMFGEFFGGTSPGARNYVQPWINAGSLPLAWGVAPLNPVAPDVARSHHLMLSSNHSGIVNVAYGDSSIRSLRTSAVTRTLRSAGGMGDGEVYDTSALGN
jgi:hypothetical protein